MTETTAIYTVQWVDRLARIPRAAWDALALPLETPLLEYDWLHLLEASGSIAPENGWQPCHLTVWQDKRLAAAAPLYIKSHSAGEFVFDHVWAELARKIGVPYYPKLVGMSPVSPVAGYRFLVRPDLDGDAMTRAMLGEIERFCRDTGLSGAHFLFADSRWQAAVAAAGYHGWHHPRFIWENPGHAGFDDFLSAFNANQRRNIRRERRSVADAGISIRFCRDREIPERYFPLMYDYYLKTNEKFGPWACRYLTRDFFEGLAGPCRRRLLFASARQSPADADPMAMAMLLVKGKSLYGRYWGAARQVNDLHFNLCYYSPLAWAIDNAMARFDPGAGGDHKLRRGFAAAATVSLHKVFDPRLQRILDLSLAEINAQALQQIDAMNRMVPFSHNTPSGMGRDFSPPRT
jgi:uncharacterized protein